MGPEEVSEGSMRDMIPETSVLFQVTYATGMLKGNSVLDVF